MEKTYARPHDFANMAGWTQSWRTLGLGEGQFARRFHNGGLYCWFAWDQENFHMLKEAETADLERKYEER